MNLNIDLNNLKDRAKEMAQSGMAMAMELTDTGVAKAKEMAEISKLKMQNITEQESIRRAYTELGKLYYAERGSAPEAGYADLCHKITQSKNQIEYNDQRIADIKAANDITDEDIRDVEFQDVEVDETDFEDTDSYVQPTCSCCCDTQAQAQEETLEDEAEDTHKENQD